MAAIPTGHSCRRATGVRPPVRRLLRARRRRHRARIVAAFAGGGAFETHVTAIDAAERVVVPALMIYAIVALLVYVAPAKRVPWRWASAGSILIVVAWLLVSAVYADWLANIVDLRTPEGTLALVLSTVGYLYASAIAFLVGAQLDQLLREGGLRAALGGRR